MKIAYITAGAGQMYCGSCLRDNTLAAALMKSGHDILLIPTYTPTRTDERNVSLHRVFLGGINIYLQQNFGFFRKTPWLLDRLFDLPAVLRFTTRWGVSVDPARLGKLTVSMLEGNEGCLHKEILRLVRFLADEVRPDVVSIPNSLLISLAPLIRQELNVPVCCTFQGEELFLDGLGDVYRNQAVQLIRKHAEYVDTFVAVSHYGADHMSGYLGIDRNRIRVVPLGINFEGYVHREVEPEVFTIGYLARLAPEKGLHALAEAYRNLRARPGLAASRLWSAGYLAPDHKPYLAGVISSLKSSGLASHFQYHGELDRERKLAYLRGLSVFSVPGPRDDPKGLFLLEAMAAGVPVVQPRCGAFTEIVEMTGGGILVAPDDPAALADGIFRLWQDPALRQELGRRGQEGVRAHFSSAAMTEKAIAVYRSLIEPEGVAVGQW
jgi:glycosyltransferase involved in cell wall biosynthesis